MFIGIFVINFAKEHRYKGPLIKECIMIMKTLLLKPVEACKEQLDKQNHINNSPSQTIPILVIWLVYLAAIIVWRIILAKTTNTGSEFDLKTLVWVAGGATFAYMLGGHVTDFIRNKSLPSGIGEIKDISRYKLLVYFWIGVSLVASVAYLQFNVLAIPHSDILTISGFISVEYIAGNRSNKVATQMCTTLEESKPKTDENSTQSI
jgi:hypothetical protein